MNPQYIYFKLVSGDEGLGLLLNDSSDVLEILDPVKVVTVALAETRTTIGMLRWCNYSQDRVFRFPKLQVAYTANLDEDTKTDYLGAVKIHLEKITKTIPKTQLLMEQLMESFSPEEDELADKENGENECEDPKKIIH